MSYRGQDYISSKKAKKKSKQKKFVHRDPCFLKLCFYKITTMVNDD